jgi:hypothetical protein
MLISPLHTRHIVTLATAALSLACATVPPDQAGELAIVVDSPEHLHTVSFDSSGNLPFTLGDLAGKHYVIHCLLRPGRYCLDSVVTGLEDNERRFDYDGECVDLRAGENVYFGHIVYDASGVHRVVDRARYEADLADPQVPKYRDRVGVSRR